MPKNDLLANLAHELRTPLAAMRGYLETLLLKEGSLPAAEQRRFLEIAARQSERLGELVAELFELARLESRGLRIDLEPVQLAELARDLVHERAERARARDVPLAVQAHAALAPVRADIRLIERALARLIDEAIGASAPGSQVLLGLVPRRARVGVRLSCTAAVHPRTGPGAAIVDRILRLHGARVRVDNVGQGSCVSFSLPIA